MKVLRYFPIIILCILLTQINVGATNREDVEEFISKAESIMNEMENNSAMKKYIPFDIFSEALLYIIYARNQLEEKSYDASYFYATLSIIKFETASILAQANKYDYDLLVKERDHYKSQGGGNKKMNEKIITLLEANLEKIGSFYRAQYLDKYIFSKKNIIKDIGKERLNSIIRIMHINPHSTATIVSHSAEPDNKNHTKMKSDIVKQYFVSKGIEPDRLETIGLGNREIMETNLGYKKVNRIEIVIKGIGY